MILIVCLLRDVRDVIPSALWMRCLPWYAVFLCVHFFALFGVSVPIDDVMDLSYALL